MRDQVDSSLAAVWTDADGTEHRIAGIALWDAYVYFSWYTENWSTLDNETRKAMWDGLDAYHVELLGHMKNSVDAAYAAAQALIKAANSTVESTSEVVVLTVLTQKEKATNAYNSSASSYRSARQTWSSAQRTFAAASRKYSKGSSQHNHALDSYQNAQEQMRDASQSYREQRQELQTSRANWNSVKAQWNATSSTQDLAIR
jgi:Sec-independent protein translocase protein TatA